MTDLELLEMAAKAAGAEIAGMRGNVPIYAMPSEDDDGVTSYARWNPLEDDGDAFRLMADLRIDVYPWIAKDRPATSVMARNSNGYRPIEYAAKNGGCRFAATRRAIVRAAAAIGEGMQ